MKHETGRSTKRFPLLTAIAQSLCCALLLHVAAATASPMAVEPLVANEHSEISIATKLDILTKATGTYALDSISGSGGPNGMWETDKVKGKWRSNISYSAGATRTVTKLKLTRADVALLNSLRIKVANLTVQLIAAGKTVETIAFQASGMQYEIKQAANRVANSTLQAISPITEVLDERLYLMARDAVDYSAVISGNFTGQTRGIVVVSYAIETDTFEVHFIDPGCCGGSVYTFKRRTP